MERISDRQLILIGAMFITVATLVNTFAQTIKVARQHAYLSYIIAAAVIAVSLWFLSKVMKRFPNQDLFQAMVGRFPIIGRMIAALYILFFFFILSRDIRMMVDFTNVVLLPATPLLVIAALIVVTVIIATRGGVEILARMTEIYAPLLIFLIFSLPFILFKEFDRTLLMPWLEFDIPGIGQGSWIALSYLGEIVALPFIFADRTFRFRYGAYGLMLGAFLIVLLCIEIIMILGTELAPRLMYPTYETVRQIRVTDFLDRFDLPIAGIWIPSMIIKIAYSLYIVCHGINRVIPDVSTKVLVIPFGVLSLVCTFWFFRNANQLINFNERWPVVSLIFQLLLPVLLFFILRPKHRDYAVNHE